MEREIKINWKFCILPTMSLILSLISIRFTHISLAVCLKSRETIYYVYKPAFFQAKPKICCSFENLAVTYVTFMPYIYFADKFSNKQEILGLFWETETEYLENSNFSLAS